MKYSVDLHIHTALSPCADKEMTPNNIINMALLKGLDFIAVTDHNSSGNAGALIKCAKDRDIVVVPGMELETSEEVHLVCLFPDVRTAAQIQKKVYRSLPDMENREDIYGTQLVMNEEDRITGRLKRLLLAATNIGLYEAFSMVRESGGAVIPAHVDRQAFSILSNLGGIPEDLYIKYLEISRNCADSSFSGHYPGISDCTFLKSSDAHSLGDILERETFLELREKSAACLLDKLRQAFT